MSERRRLYECTLHGWFEYGRAHVDPASGELERPDAGSPVAAYRPVHFGVEGACGLDGPFEVERL